MLFNNTHESLVFFWLKKNLIYQKRNIIRIICLFDIILPETHARTYRRILSRAIFFFFFPIFHLFIHAQPHPILTHIVYWLFFYLSLSSSFHTRSYKVTTPSPHLASFSILSPLVALFFLIAIIIYAFFSPPLLVVVVVVVTLYTRLFFFFLFLIYHRSHLNHTHLVSFLLLLDIFFFFRAMTNPPTHHPLAPPRQFSFIKKKTFTVTTIRFLFFFLFLFNLI